MFDPVSLRTLCVGIALCLSGIVAAHASVGEGDNTDTTARMQSLALAKAPPAMPASVAPRNLDVSCGLNGVAGIHSEVKERVNALRAAGAVCGSKTFAATAPLAMNGLLLLAASGHSSDMAQNNYFSHTSLDGRTLVQRVVATGYNYKALAENIAAGQPTVESAMSSWTNSPGHCENLMDPAFRDIAVACARRRTPNSSDYYWTMVLGRSVREGGSGTVRAASRPGAKPQAPSADLRRGRIMASGSGSCARGLC